MAKLENNPEDLNSIPIAKTAVTYYDFIIKYLADTGIYRNDITREYEIDGEVQTDGAIKTLFIDFKRQYPEVKGANWQAFELVLNSDDIKTRNPLKEYLAQLKTVDKTTHTDRLLSSLELIENPAMVDGSGRNNTRLAISELFKKWLIGLVASADRGNYNPLMPVLIGPKNCGKTHFFRHLLPEKLKGFFSQSKFDQGKDSEALMCEKLLILNDELDGMMQKEAKAFRNFISAETYTYRPPYGRSNITRPRLASVCGTANDRAVIMEGEHNRRIVPILINSIDRDLYNQVDKTKLIAELYSAYRRNEAEGKKGSWHLDQRQVETVSKISEEHEIETPELSMLQVHTTAGKANEWLTTTEIRTSLLGLNPGALIGEKKLGQALHRLGYKRETRRKSKFTHPVKCWNVRIVRAEYEQHEAAAIE